MTTILNKRAFKLPRVDKEKFVSLMHMGLDYNREKGVFSIKSCDNIEIVIDVISDILNTDVVFLQNCARCGKDFACNNCKYYELCTTKNLPFTCVCPQCLRDRKQFEEFLEKF